jgi:hypothetical protein
MCLTLFYYFKKTNRFGTRETTTTAAAPAPAPETTTTTGKGGLEEVVERV